MTTALTSKKTPCYECAGGRGLKGKFLPYNRPQMFRPASEDQEGLRLSGRPHEGGESLRRRRARLEGRGGTGLAVCFSRVEPHQTNM